MPISKQNICSRCVMDTSDPQIVFDGNNRCNHCTDALERAAKEWMPDERGALILERYLNLIRKDGRGKEFDCIIGLSGGVDSSYLAYKSKNWGLRPLIFHVDGGWNTPESEHNVSSIAKYLKVPLHTYTVNWEEMRDLQRAFLQAGVPNQDIPQDHLFFSVLFSIAQQMGIRYWLSGSNFVGECILPGSWGYNAMDVRQLRDIHKKFGKTPLKTYPTLSFLKYCQYYLGLGSTKVQMLTPLNWIPYHVEKARAILATHCGWKSYGRKHCESRFTRYFQCHYLPQRFGFDKRKAHYSSLIVSGQMTRIQALDALQQPLYNPVELAEDEAYLIKKLGYSKTEWHQIMQLPPKKHEDYLTSHSIEKLAMRLKTAQNAVTHLYKREFSILFNKITNKFR